jgi:hypothetical protein
VGAVRVVVYGEPIPFFHRYPRADEDYLSALNAVKLVAPTKWNDRPSRTKKQVVAKLRRAAER